MVKALYSAIFKRTSTFTVAILAGSFMFERGIDVITNQIFESINEGKLWKHMKHKYEA